MKLYLFFFCKFQLAKSIESEVFSNFIFIVFSHQSGESFPSDPIVLSLSKRKPKTFFGTPVVLPPLVCSLSNDSDSASLASPNNFDKKRFSSTQQFASNFGQRQLSQIISVRVLFVQFTLQPFPIFYCSVNGCKKKFIIVFKLNHPAFNLHFWIVLWK